MTEVEEGFVSTAVEHELANPKLYGKDKSLVIFSAPHYGKVQPV